MTEWVWKSWAATKRSIEADLVEFHPHHVAFYSRELNAMPQLILAIKNEDIGDLHPVNEGDPAWW